ncbi:MAG: hypothetical protein QG608_1444 [Actinomycetota bacterium]|nr:hypothetical protein [Actinomycetota bacterium]
MGMDRRMLGILGRESYSLSNVVRPRTRKSARAFRPQGVAEQAGEEVNEPDRIGRRVRYWRERRGLTRGHFADLMGRSPSWVDKVEAGERKLDRLSVLEQVASALDLPLHVLVDDDACRLRAQCVDAAEVTAIRAALQHHEPADPAPDEPEPDLDRLQRQVLYAWLAFQSSDYASLGPVLARLLTAAQRARRYTDTSRRPSADALLTQTYQIAASTARKLGRYDLEWIAADRGWHVAQDVEDPVLRGGATFRVINAYQDNAGATAAVALARTAARTLIPSPASGSVGCRSVYGHILLQGAMSAAVDNNASAARELLDEAHQTAALLGQDRNDYYTAFGPTNVLIHQVAAMVQLREWSQALQAADRINEHHLRLLPKERRANHLLDVARAHSLAGHREESLSHLLHAERLAPREVRCRPIALDLITDLIRRSRNPSPELRRLATRTGITT